MITQLAIISVFVTIIDQFLKAYLFPLSKVMSVFVGLIITNCIVMGRAEGMAKNIKPLPALMDGFGAGTGYMLVICVIGGIREFFGFGQLLGRQIIPLAWYATPEAPNRYENFGLMVNPPAAFFIIGCMIWIFNIMSARKKHP
jgi:Na+-transporting NADH:ubiquinone oxidoreductase subunit D